MLKYFALTSFKSIILILILILIVAYYVLLERKTIAYMQDRIGPNRVGYFGLLQPIADAIKLFLKERIIPINSNKYLFIIAPIISFTFSYAAWAVIPFNINFSISCLNSGIIYILAMTSLSVYGIIFAGWASNSKYAMIAAIRAGAQFISYELSIGISVLGVIIISGSLNLTEIILNQSGNIFNWNFIPLFPLFIIFFVSGVAETGRAPFDIIESESEIVAGYHIEYSGSNFALFFLSEYANMILVSFLTTIFFLGGWNPPFSNYFFCLIPNIIWLLSKSFIFMFIYIWIRSSFPRYRYDQLMKLNWKFFIPVGLFWIIIISFLVQLGII